MRAKLISKAGLMLVSTLAAFSVCELAARLVYPAPPDPGREPQIVYRYDPEIGYVPAPNQKGWIEDGLITVNSLGFRGREVTLPKPAGRFRIVVVGDSLTLGWGVGDDETYSARLEQLLLKDQPNRDVDVINGGIGGYNTRQEIELLKRHVPLLRPDLVLVGFYTNDVPGAFDDPRPSSLGGTRMTARHLEPGQVLHMTHGSSTSWWDHQVRKSRALYVAGRALTRLSGRAEDKRSAFSMELDLLEGRESPSLDRAWRVIEQQLAELGELATSARFSVGLVPLPCREQVMGEFPNARYQSRVASIARRLGFDVIDPLPSMIATKLRKSGLFIPYDRNHPSAAGHDIVAQTILQHLQQHDSR